MESRTKRLGLNTIFVFMGKAGSSIIGLLMLPFYTRWLSPEDYGTSDLVFTYTSIFVSVVTCCMSDAIFIYAKRASNRDRVNYFTSGLCFLFGSFSIFALLSLIVKAVGFPVDITNVIFEHAWFILAITVCSALQQYTQAFSQAIDEIKIYTMTGVVFTLSIAIASFVLLPILGLEGYLCAYVIANLTAALFSLIFSRSYRYIDINKIESNKCKELLSYGVPIIPNTIMWWLVSGINRPIMESSLGLSAIGLFAVANKIPGIISMLCGIFNTAWNITMLEEYGKEDFNEFFNKVVKSIFLFLVFAGVVISIFSKSIIAFLATDEFFDAWTYVPFLVLAVLLQNLSGLIGGVFAAQKKSKFFFYSSIWGAVTSLVFTYLLINWLGMFGVCLAMIISFLSIIISRLVYAWQDIDKFNIRYYVSITLLYLAIAGTVVSSLEPVVKACIYAIIIVVMFLTSKDVLKSIKVLLCKMKR